MIPTKEFSFLVRKQNAPPWDQNSYPNQMQLFKFRIQSAPDTQSQQYLHYLGDCIS